MRVLVILLAFMLPLRVISAESMALSMMMGTVAATAQQATYPPQQSMEMDHSMPMEDCPFMGKAEQAPDGVHGHQEHCQTCQICMVWATPPTLGPLLAGIPAAPTHTLREDFESAVLAPDLRPPISLDPNP